MSNKASENSAAHEGRISLLKRLSSAAACYLLLAACDITLSLSNATMAQQRRGPLAIPGEIRGQVRVAGGEATLRGVMINLEAEGGGIVQQATTDDLGKFSFAGLSNGVYFVIAHASGYHAVHERADLSTSPRAFVQLRLIPVPEEKSPFVSPSSTISAKGFELPADVIKEVDKGKQDLLKNDFDSAVRHFEKAIKIYPSAPEAHLLLGTAKVDLAKLSEAENEFKRAIELDERMAAAYFALGDLCNLQRRYSEAKEILLKGLRLDDTSWQGHFALGKTYWAMSDVKNAEPHLMKAHALNPDFAQVHILMGNVCLRKREPERAVSEFEHYLKLEPNGQFSTQVRGLVKRIRDALKAQQKSD